MKLYASFMAFLHHERRRIPTGIFALTAGDEPAPRLKVGFIPGICFRPYLKQYGIYAYVLQSVKLLQQYRFHLIFRHSHVVSRDSRQPCSSKFPFRSRLRRHIAKG